MSININIADNLRRLRKQREITQEDLANFLGISFQAVSKWECGDGYPDITILPALANFFDVTVDELIGMNEIKNQAKLEEIKTEHNKLTAEGKIKEDIALLREALKIFPNDYWLLAELACYLDSHDETEEERNKNYDEAIKISERIIEFCPDPVIRNNAQANMCFFLWRRGNKDRAIEIAEKLPNIYKTREFTLNRFLKRDKQIEECKKAIEKLGWGFWWQIDILSQQWQSPLVEEHEHYTAEQAIILNQKAIDIFKIIYEEDDFYFQHNYLTRTYENIAQIYAKIGKIDECIENLEKAAEHAVAVSTFPETGEYKSLLVNKLIYKKGGSSRSTEKNEAHILKHHIENIDFYDLNNKFVQKILDKLGEYAN